MLTCVGFTATAGGILGLAAKLVFFAFVIGFLAFFFWRVLSIHPVIVSLILSYLIYSAILYKFGPNMSGDGLWRLSKSWKSLLLIHGTIAAVSVVLFAFQRSLAGRRFIAVACNPDLAKAMGMRTWVYQIGGLVLAVLFTQVSGLFHASYYGYANISDSTGFLLIAIFAVFLAQAFYPRVHFILNSICCLAGLILFNLALNAAIEFGLPPSLTKGGIGLALAALLVLSRWRKTAHPIQIG